jgi:hypothetical protein
MTAKRLATIAAALGLGAGLIAPVRVVNTFVSNTGHGPGILGLWMIVPIAAGATAIGAVRTQSVGLVWTAVGAVWGFVILGAWSFGLFFAWEALALLSAGVLHLVAVGRLGNVLLAPLWFMAGLTSLCPVFAAVDVSREMRSFGNLR